MGGYRAVLLSGPPGVGKTTSAHLVAKLTGYTAIEVNASDARNKKLLEVGADRIERLPLCSLLTGFVNSERHQHHQQVS